VHPASVGRIENFMHAGISETRVAVESEIEQLAAGLLKLSDY
jgi:hypothetical protein